MVETYPDITAGNNPRHGHEKSDRNSAVVYLSTAATPVERALVRDWVRAQPRSLDDPAPQIVPIHDDATSGLADWLASPAAEHDPLLVPLRVVWLPPERGGERVATWGDLLSFRDPRRPRGRSQARIVRRHCDRVQVVAAEGARLHELTQRHAHRTEPATEQPPSGLAAFVLRQALLSLERAERAVIGDRYKVPRLVVDEITSGARFAQRTADLARRLDRSPHEVREQVVGCLHELVAVQSRLAMDVFAATMRPFHARAWNVVADTADLEALRELNRRHALVFLPSHRSYADPFVLAEALRSVDFPRNHVMGGANLSFWPVAPLARRAGVVFIRRSFGEDEAYKLAVREYFGYLVAKRFNLEWYFEGGRSRTGKLRPPRYGLLRYLAEALAAEPGTDVHLVPVSITYEHLAEVSAMAAEQRGVAKQREGVTWLARYARTQREPAGNAVVRFAAPVSMRARLPEGAGGDPAQVPLQKLAFEVAAGINAATPVLARAAVTLTMLGAGGRALTVAELHRLLEPVLRYVEARAIPQSGLRSLRTPAEVRRVLEELERAEVVTSFRAGAEPVYQVHPEEYLVAAFYRNTAIHWFVNRAIVELVMLTVADSVTGDLVEAAWQEALRLRDLLKYEFFFDDKSTFRAQLAAELDLLDHDWRGRSATEGEVERLLTASGFLMAHRVLLSFVEAQFVVADRLAAADPAVPIESTAFLKRCEGMGRQLLLQGRLHSGEAVSRELFASAMRLADGRGLLAAEPDVQRRRQEFRDELADVVRRLERAAALDAQIAEGQIAEGQIADRPIG